jgi:hypothetical protein
MSDKAHGPAIGRQETVGGDELRLLHAGLRDEQTVERIVVEQRQPGHGDHMVCFIATCGLSPLNLVHLPSVRYP